MIPVSQNATQAIHYETPDETDSGKAHGSKTPSWVSDPQVKNQLIPGVEQELEAEKAAKAEQKAEQQAEAAQKLQAAQQVHTTALPEFLTPQSLVAYCDCRLTSLDSQMQQIFNQQQTNAATTDAVSQVADDLNDLPGPNSATPPMVNVTSKQAKEIQSDYLSAIEAAKAGGEGSAQLVGSLEQDLLNFQNQFRDGKPALTKLDAAMHFPDDNNATFSVASSTITNLSQNLKTDGSDLNNDSQMSMINLQSLMQQQQTAVELSSNLMQTMGQTTENTVANTKAS